MDGECTSMTYDKIHARSEDSKDHPSRHWVKRLHADLKDFIPEGMEIFGENMYAKHSIKYDKLDSYFLVFNIAYWWNFLEWDKIEAVCDKLGLYTVPVLYKGPKVEGDWFTGKSKMGGEQEGYVIRNAYAFGTDQRAFSDNCAKFVRANHVQTDDHWMHQAIIKNGLANEELLRKIKD